MSNKFKQQAAQKRAGVPQVDLESAKVDLPAPNPAPVIKSEPAPPAPVEHKTEAAPEPEAASQPQRITQVDTSEIPTNRGFSMYPSRHRQIAKDLAYIENRNPWKIIDDAIEEYVIKHYGKEYKRR